MDIQQTLIDRKIVHRDQNTMGGVLVFIGTHVPLQTLFDYLESEESSMSCAKEFLADFPHLRTPALQIIEIVSLSSE